MKIYGLDKKGNIIAYDVIMTFKGSNDYVIYTDNSIDENNNLKVYSAIYNPKTELLIREPSSELELKEVKEALKSVFNG